MGNLGPFVTGLLALWTTSSANAQGTVQSCAAMPDDGKRLHCYDALFRTKSTESTKSAWQIKEETSKIDDSKNVYAALESSEAITNPYGQRRKAVLLVRCAEKKTSLYLTFADHFISSIQQYGTVTYRIDRNPAQKRGFQEFTDHKALGLWSGADAIPFIRQLYGGDTLFVQATPYNQSPVTAEFQITGTQEALEPVRAACGWSVSKPAPKR